MKTVFLDIDDTLLDYEKGSELALKKTCQQLGIPYSSATLAIYRQIDEELWTKQKKGELTIKQVLMGRARQFLEQTQSPQPYQQFQTMFQQNLGEEAVVVEGAPEMLDYLHQKGYRLYAASNGILDTQLNRLSKAQLLHFFEDTYVSDAIGYEKPDPEFFNECLKRSGASSESTFMLGDSLTADIQGAINAGLIPIWFNKHQRSKPKSLPRLLELTKLEELPKLGI